MNVIFMGTPDYADAILKKLIDEKEMQVKAVFTQPDKPVGRKKVLTAPVVKQTARAAGIEVYQPISLKQEDYSAIISSYKPDFIVVAAFGQILPRQILEIAPCINLHASILPQYRGASPIQQSLLNGDTQSGVTAMLMNEGMDTGAILKVATLPIDSEMMVETLFNRLTSLAADLTVDVLYHFNRLEPQAQNNDDASYCKKITKEEGKIIFDDAETIFNKYRAFTPWPGIFLESGLKIKALALLEKEREHQAGEILAISEKGVTVGCLKGSLLIETVQPASKKTMHAQSYLNGQRLECGDTLL